MSRILVVDDEARIRQIIRKYAEFEGFEVEEAVDGMQAIEICRKEDFDLIIMDVMMPEMDGFEATAIIRKSEKGNRHTPIVALTAHAMKEHRDRCLEAGMDDLQAYTAVMAAHIQWNGMRGFLAVPPEIKDQGVAVGRKIGGGINGIMTDVAHEMIVPEKR